MKLAIRPDRITGRIKPMNAVNNGPVYTENADQNLTNLPAYKAAHIPFARTHDASICYSYGGEHTVDVCNIFPNFAADPLDPASYDFTLTDQYMEHIMMAGTGVFYRLGSKIEHWKKHYGTVPPEDPQKWAVICEHIIRHMNEGWADGHHYGIRYWEIWNEPDSGKCWTGTPEQFYELYAVTARHLKACFPDLKVGGPAVTWFHEDWLRPFFAKIRDEKIPMDFYSWHRYSTDVGDMVNNVRLHRALMEEYGLGNAESILNEWNYVRGFCGEDWAYSLRMETDMKGAAFAAAVMAACQTEPVDMLMYYDARASSGMNGMFSDHFYELLPTYHVVKTWGDMLEMGKSCEVCCDVPDIWAACAVSEGEICAMITYYSDDDNALPRRFTVELPGDRLRTVWLLDDGHAMTPCMTIAPEDGRFTLTMEVNTTVVIR